MPNIWLTQTKFVPPQLRDDFVSRSRLMDSLRASVESHPLTLVSAPAGYGKTTLVASLFDKPVVWVSLDEEDNDLTRFFIALVMAAQKLDSTFGENIQSLLTSLENPAQEARRIVSALINEIMEKLPEVWLVLDDLHTITEPAIYLALDYLLEHIPPRMHLVVTTRHDPPLSLARLRARGQLAELRAPDLCFTTDEVRLFLNEKQHLGLSTDDLTKLQSRAEGWAAGLRLLAGSLDHIPSASDRTAFIQDLALTDRFVFDFLADEVLKRQEPDTRAFLLDTSILPELTPSLCNTLTGRNDAQVVLEDLYRRNLFLTQSEETGRAFRYHALFAEFLREQLKREQPERFVELHRRAAEAQKTAAPSRAIAHYLAAELWDDAAQVMESASEGFILQGLLMTVRGWIEALPESIRDARPRLLYALGFCALQHGRLNDAMTLFESARRGFENNGDQVSLAETLLLMIDTASRQHDYARQAALTQQALAIPLPVHGQVQLLMAQAWQLLFEKSPVQAEAALEKALALTMASSDLRAYNVVAPVLNGNLAFLPGGAALLENYCRQVLARFGDGISSVQACAHSLLSFLVLLKGAVEESAHEAGIARLILDQIGELAYTDWNTTYVQGMTAGLRGDRLKQEKLWVDFLPKMEQIPSLRPHMVILLYLIGHTQWVQKKIDQARQMEARISAISDQGEFPETIIARFSMRALIDINARKFDEAERILVQAIAIEQQWPHAVLIGSGSLLLAYLYLQRGYRKEAWAHFAPFLAECEKKNRPLLILREMEIAIPLLHLAIERKSNMDFAQRLLDQLSASDSPKPVTVPETGQTLTAREVEVLKLIAEGASNQVIAQRLVISEHTVKAHTTSIFAKLQVASRTEAAALARELRLV